VRKQLWSTLTKLLRQLMAEQNHLRRELNVLEKALEIHFPKFDSRLNTTRTHYKRVLAHITFPDDQELAALDQLIAVLDRGKHTPEN
jgi:hypothetical protein